MSYRYYVCSSMRYSPKSIGTMFLVIAFLGTMTVATAAVAKAAAPAAGVEDVSYPASMFDNGKARHFQVKGPDGITIKYFIMKS
jgi:hypothetical protein